MSSGPAPSQLTIWVVSDGRAGIENQALGLAEAVKRQLEPEHQSEIVTLRVRLDFPADKIAPFVFGDIWQGLKFADDPSRMHLEGLAESLRKGDGLVAPDSWPDLWPDLWIACGRQTVPLTIDLCRRGRSLISGQGPAAPFCVQLQNPRRSSALFDLVVAPNHDHLSGKNVFSMIGAPNRIHETTIDKAREKLRHVLGFPSGSKRVPVTIMVGGPNKVFPFAARDQERLVAAIEQEARLGRSVIVSASRRTPAVFAERLRTVTAAAGGYFYDPQHDEPGSNPYPGVLGLGGPVLVTEDSVNMLSEAATAGVALYRFPLVERRRPVTKFDSLVRTLRDGRHLRDYDANLEHFSPPSFLETDRAAKALIDAYYRSLSST
ncbi:MAG: mitochondrial fission ELM1 family protein [Pseudomonadota bacterium]